MNDGDIRKAILWAWQIASVPILLALVLPFVVPPDALAGVLPVCEAKKQQRECILCGMTTGFYAIGRGEFESATAANAASLPLFSAMAVNEIAVAVVLARLIAGRLRHKENSGCRS
ncbi:MAG: DUF2752 domain-containing protein [Bryobacteraceae bacterium]